MERRFNFNRTMGAAAMVSSIILEVSTAVSIFPMGRYIKKYKDHVAAVNDNKLRIKKSGIRTAVLGVSAITLAAVSFRLNKKNKTGNDSGDTDVHENKPEMIDMKTPDNHISTSDTSFHEGQDNSVSDNSAVQPDIQESVIKPEPGDAGETDKDSGTNWNCAECGHGNPGYKKVCSYCGTLREDILNQSLREW